MSVPVQTAIAEDQPKPPYVKDLSCTEGPFRLHLPATYQAVRAIGQVRNEKVVEGGFRVDQSIDEAMSRLGVRTGTRGELLVSGDADALRLGVNGGKVARIAYESYTG